VTVFYHSVTLYYVNPSFIDYRCFLILFGLAFDLFVGVGSKKQLKSLTEKRWLAGA
jgi:hypothetical protein